MLSKIIEKPENVKLREKIILNGKIAEVATFDDNYETVGIKNIRKLSTFSGGQILSEDGGFALTKELEDRLGWKNHWANVMFVTGKEPIDPIKVEETIIESLYGDAKAEYTHHYSDYTGYLWTDEGFIVGGHDLYKILQSHIGEYIHLEIELYELK